MFKSIYLGVLAALIGTNIAQAGNLQFRQNELTAVNSCDTQPNVTCIVATGAAIPAVVGPDPDLGELLVWEENRDVLLGSSIFADDVADPGASFVSVNASGFDIAAGTLVTSYIVQWDSLLGNPRNSVATNIFFQETIIGLILGEDSLLATDPILGLPSITYLDINSRGVERSDTVAVGTDGISVNFDLRSSTPGDWIRVLTDGQLVQVSEPGTLPILCIALLFLASNRLVSERRTL